MQTQTELRLTVRRITTVAMAFLIGIPATHLSAQEPAEKKTQYEVQVGELKLQEDAASQLLTSHFLNKKDELKEAFRKAIQDLDARMIELRRNPNSKELKAAYEEVLSQALTDVGEYLESLANEESNVMSTLSSLSRTYTETTVTARKTLNKLQQDTKIQKQQVAQADLAIEQLLDKFEPYLTSDEPLPRDVERDLRLLESDRATLVTLQIVAAADEELVRRQLQLLETRGEELLALQDNLELVFNQAHGDQIVLSRIAGYKARELSTTEMIAQQSALVEGLAPLGPIFDDVKSLFDSVLNVTPAMLPEASELKLSNSSDAKDVLRRAAERRRLRVEASSKTDNPVATAATPARGE